MYNLSKNEKQQHLKNFNSEEKSNVSFPAFNIFTITQKNNSNVMNHEMKLLLHFKPSGNSFQSQNHESNNKALIDQFGSTKVAAGVCGHPRLVEPYW